MSKHVCRYASSCEKKISRVLTDYCAPFGGRMPRLMMSGSVSFWQRVHLSRVASVQMRWKRWCSLRSFAIPGREYTEIDLQVDRTRRKHLVAVNVLTLLRLHERRGCGWRQRC